MAKLDGPTLLTQADYARHRAQRQLPGASREAVRKAVDAGRISTIGDEKLIDPAVADIQWAANTRARTAATAGKTQSRTTQGAGGGVGQAAQAAPDALTAMAEAAGTPAPSAPAVAAVAAPSEYSTHRTRREAADAITAEIRAAEAQGRVIEKDPALLAVYTAFRGLRDAMMPVGRKCAARAATMDEPRQIQAMIEAATRDALNSFATKTLASLARRLAGPRAEVDNPMDELPPADELEQLHGQPAGGTPSDDDDDVDADGDGLQLEFGGEPA